MIFIQDFITKNWYSIILVFTCIVIGYAVLPFLGKDNMIEQAVEEIIEEETGIKTDLTPEN